MNNRSKMLFQGVFVGTFILILISMKLVPDKLFQPPEIIYAAELDLTTAFSSSDYLIDEKASPAIRVVPSPSKVKEDCSISPSFSQSIQQWCKLITKHSRVNGLHPDLIAALILQESGGQVLAYSHSGAVGLMQVMPRDGIASTFVNAQGVPFFASRPTIKELEKPNFNIKYGTKYLKGLIIRHGNLREALKSYGPYDVGYAYADKVLSIYHNTTQE